MGHVAITTHSHPSNDSAGQLEWHPPTVRIIVKKLASIKAYHRPMAESLVVSNCHSGGLLVDRGSRVCTKSQSARRGMDLARFLYKRGRPRRPRSIMMSPVAVNQDQLVSPVLSMDLTYRMRDN